MSAGVILDAWSRRAIPVSLHPMYDIAEAGRLWVQRLAHGGGGVKPLPSGGHPYWTRHFSHRNAALSTAHHRRGTCPPRRARDPSGSPRRRPRPRETPGPCGPAQAGCGYLGTGQSRRTLPPRRSRSARAPAASRPRVPWWAAPRLPTGCKRRCSSRAGPCPLPSTALPTQRVLFRGCSWANRPGDREVHVEVLVVPHPRPVARERIG